MPMVFIGMTAPRWRMKSKRPSPTSGSSVSAQKRRTCGSISSIRLGVKTRLNSPRWRSCSGGSSQRMFPRMGGPPLLITSSTEPRPDR